MPLGTVVAATFNSAGHYTTSRNISGEPAEVFGLKTGWWSFTPPITGPVTVSTDGTAGDAFFRVYSSTDLASTVIDNSGTGPDGSRTFTGDGGHTYYVAVTGWFDDTSITGNVTLTIDALPTPTAYPITFTSGTYTDTRDISGAPVIWLYGVQTALWTFIAGTSIATTFDLAGSAGDYWCEVLESDLSTSVAANYDGPNGSFTADLVAGRRYYVAVTDWAFSDTFTGDVTLTVTVPSIFMPDPDAPGPTGGDSEPADYNTDESRAIWQNTDTYPAPALAGGVPDGWDRTPGVDVAWGWLSVAIDGTDVTLFRGAPTRIQSFEDAEPWGYGAATFLLPAVAGFETPGAGALAFLRRGATVVVRRVHPDGTSSSTFTDVRWAGLIVDLQGTATETGTTYTVACAGIAPGSLATQPHRPKPYQPAVDLGVILPAAVNQAWSRRLTAMPTVTTGIQTRYAGSWSQSILDYATELISRFGGDEDGSQWSIRHDPTDYRGVVLAKKNTTLVNATVRYGQQGLSVNLSADVASAPNIIYGRGVNADGYSWAGWKYPGTTQSLSYKPYPMGTTGLISVGTSDAGTTSGTGVSDAQRAMNDLSLRGLADVPVDGVWSSQDAKALKVIQDDAGISVDGVLGPQSWSTLFPQYPRGYLDGATRFPLALKSVVRRFNYYPDGSVKEPNPGYDPTVIPVGVDYEYGSGVSKGEATASARSELARVPGPGLVGELVLHGCDPAEGSRMALRAGHNVLLKGYEGRDVLLHVAQVVQQPDEHTTRLTVDEHARDLAQVAGILARDVETRNDPVRLPARRVRRSQVAQDQVVEFDGESAGGIIHPLALIGGLWVLVDIPVSQAGRVASLTLHTSPATKFSVAFFGDLGVTASDLVSLVGNPLSTRSDHYGAYDHEAKALEALGFIQGIGQGGQAAGYDHPGTGGSGYETSPYDGGSTPLTGWLRTTAGWQYRSTRPPFLRVAFYAPSSCTISGRLLPAPMDI